MKKVKVVTVKGYNVTIYHVVENAWDLTTIKRSMKFVCIAQYGGRERHSGVIIITDELFIYCVIDPWKLIAHEGLRRITKP